MINLSTDPMLFVNAVIFSGLIADFIFLQILKSKAISNLGARSVTHFPKNYSPILVGKLLYEGLQEVSLVASVFDLASRNFLKVTVDHGSVRLRLRNLMIGTGVIGLLSLAVVAPLINVLWLRGYSLLLAAAVCLFIQLGLLYIIYAILKVKLSKSEYFISINSQQSAELLTKEERQFIEALFSSFGDKNGIIKTADIKSHSHYHHLTLWNEKYAELDKAIDETISTLRLGTSTERLVNGSQLFRRSIGNENPALMTFVLVLIMISVALGLEFGFGSVFVFWPNVVALVGIMTILVRSYFIRKGLNIKSEIADRELLSYAAYIHNISQASVREISIDEFNRLLAYGIVFEVDRRLLAIRKYGYRETAKDSDEVNLADPVIADKFIQNIKQVMYKIVLKYYPG